MDRSSAYCVLETRGSEVPLIPRVHVQIVKPTLYLCAGLQSSGSTLVSWCFLQRQDMNGILDGRGDVLPEIPRDVGSPRTWCKFVITAFRLRDMVQRYQDEGWQVYPLLVVRDVRAVFNSLVTKPYGRNGVTAEEPPLRLRLLRFKEDWTLCRSRRWPIIRYESLVSDPDTVLRQTCRSLKLAWDSGMLHWPKPQRDIAFVSNGNETFLKTRGRTLAESMRPELANLSVSNIPPGDLAWMEEEFADYNAVLGYPAHVAPSATHHAGVRIVPRFENTKRYRQLRRKKFLEWLGRHLPVVGKHWHTLHLRALGLK